MSPRINKVKNRILFLSPSVVSGEDREWTKDDFESLNNSSIGVGGFGRVYKVRHKGTKGVYAIKVIGKDKIIENNLVDQMKLEVRIMYQLNHPKIIKLYNHFEDNESFYLVQELAQKGQLYGKLKLLGRLDERLAAQYIREVSSAVMYLHSLNPPIIHRDIKPENILLDENESSKLCDFGWSNFGNQDKKRTTYCGTPEYLAPEMIRQDGHDKSLDYWNIGVLCFELLTGRPPFEGATQKELFDNIAKVRINYPKDFPKLAKDLIGRLLKSNPKERIKGEELLEHAWFKANPPYKKSIAGSISSYKSNNKNSLSKDSASKHSDLKVDGLGENDSGKDDRDLVLDKLNTKYQEAYKQAIEMKANFQNKTKELEALKKENQELNEHLGKLGKEFTPQAAIEAKKMNEEIQKLKILNKNREEIISELDQKGKMTAEYDAKISILQSELDGNKRENEIATRKLKELQDREETLNNKYKTLKRAYEEKNKEKESKFVELEAKLETLHVELINKTEDEGENNLEAMMELVRTVLEDIRDKTFPRDKAKKESDDLNEECISIYNKLNEFNAKCRKETYEQQNQYEKKLEEAKSKLAEERKAFIDKMNLKVETFKKSLELEKGQEKEVIDNNKLKSIYEEQDKELNKLRSALEMKGRQMTELKGVIEGMNKKISELEMKAGELKGKVLFILTD